MRQPLTFETEYTRDDYRAFRGFIVRRGVRKQRAARHCIALLLIATYLGLWFARPKLVRSPAFGAGALMMIVFFVAAVLINRRLLLPGDGGAFLKHHRI